MGVASILRGFGIFALGSVVFAAGCGGGGGSSSGTVTVNCTQGSGANITISGQVTFDHVHHSSYALDYTNITQDPVRGATVEAVCNGVLSSTKTDSNGNYTLNVPGDSIDFVVRVVAEMKQTGTPSWDFTVVDNTQNQAVYTMDSTPFDTGSSNITRNLNAASGWGGSSYTSTRVAAPFAILDSVYVAFNKVLSANANAIFPALKLNWSINNIASSGSTAAGQITTSHFNGTEIFILGAADSDTDEYDDHVIIHEWGHYFEEFFSRSDSIGGSHGSGDILDIRVAFGEGFGNAFSGIASDDPIYRDSAGLAQGSGFGFDVDANDCGAITDGWFSECSVQSILYDLYDNTVDGFDTLNLGFNPIFNVLTGEQRTTSAMTSIFSFISPLKTQTGLAAAIDTLVGGQDIDAIGDIYGDSETTNNPGTTNQIPVHTDIQDGGAIQQVCSTKENGSYNGLGVHRFLKFTATGGATTIVATRNPNISSADPDMELFRNGVSVALSESVVNNSETMVISNLAAGDYVLDVYEYSYVDDTGTGTTCFNIDIN